ncbi:hypothetical protein BKA63DRAFT_585380 [Paraphoma chrysanthemicola]|nr:hypothetical protein BKA63DRAFT_585380 [Paraphoma chrysanthemicola]
MVQSKFATASVRLIDTLGLLNFQRYKRLADARHGRSEAPFEPEEMISVAAKSTYFQDSGIGTSLARPVTATVNTSYAPTLAFTMAESSRAKLPSIPRIAKLGSFFCEFCGSLVAYTGTREYQQHLLRDLQPYSCLEVDCPSSNRSFQSRHDWTAHLRSSHDIHIKSPSRPCPLCAEPTGEGAVAICRHYADHLEDIALAASPLALDEDDDVDADSSNLEGKQFEHTAGLIPSEEEYETSLEISRRGSKAQAAEDEDMTSGAPDYLKGKLALRGTPQGGWFEKLDARYRVQTRSEAKRFFRPGRVFALLVAESWSGPKCIQSENSQLTLVRYGEHVYATMRNFVAVQANHDINVVYACAMTTYGRRGVIYPGCVASEHAPVYVSSTRPSLLKGEREIGMTIEPFAIDLTDEEWTLDSTCRIRLSRTYSIEMNVKVRDIGMIVEQDRERLLNCYRNQIRE